LFVVRRDEKQNLPVGVTEVRAESYSLDGNNIVISLRTKYSANERKYSVPVECFRDLIIDLQRLNVAATPTQPDQPTEQAKSVLPEISIIPD